MVFLKEFLEKVDFEKNQHTTTKHVGRVKKMHSPPYNFLMVFLSLPISDQGTSDETIFLLLFSLLKTSKLSQRIFKFGEI